MPKNFLKEQNFWNIWAMHNESGSTEWDPLTTAQIKSIRLQHDRAMMFLARCRCKWERDARQEFGKFPHLLAERLQTISECIARGTRKCESPAFLPSFLFLVSFYLPFLLLWRALSPQIIAVVRTRCCLQAECHR